MVAVINNFEPGQLTGYFLELSATSYWFHLQKITFN